MRINNKWGLSIVILCFFLILPFIFPTTALAQGINIDDTVKKGEVLDQNLFLSGPEVVMDGKVNGDLVSVGNNVTINGEVNGSLIAIGQKVFLNGPLSGTAYVAALELELGPLANIERDVYYVGTSLKTQEGSSINRDLNAVSLGADLSGSIGGDINAVVGPVNLVQSLYKFMLDQGWLSQPLKLNFPWFQGGYGKQAIPGIAFGLQSIQNFNFSSSASGSEPTLIADQGFQASQQAGTIDVERLKGWAIPFLRNLAALLILGLLALWLLPAQLSFAGEQVRVRPWRTLLTGLLVFVIGWFVALLALILILALAIFFYWVSLPNLGFLIGTLGLSSLGIAMTIFWLDIVFFSKIVVAYLCGVLFFQRFLPKYAQRKIWPFLTGVVVYALLASIPYLGWLVAIIATFLGLGAIWKLSAMLKQPEKPVSDQPQIIEEVQELSTNKEE
jgi:cytoskeletal protein CcmA (bactofilin family)